MGASLGDLNADDEFDEAHDINVTPFIDVMLVLLIIFMVASAVAVIDVKVALPPAVAPPTPNPPKPVFISIKDSGQLFVGNHESDPSTLGEDLKEQIGARNPARERIFIRGDKNTTYGDFMKVMIKLQDNGFYSVALVGEDKG